MVLYSLIIGLWALGLLLLRRPISPSLIPTLILAQGLIVVQGFLGLLLLFSGHRPVQLVHLVYGLAAAVSIPGAYLYIRHRSDRSRLLGFFLMSIWLVGLSVRGIVTGM